MPPMAPIRCIRFPNIRAVNRNMFRAILLDGWSEVILNAKGEVMK